MSPDLIPSSPQMTFISRLPRSNSLVTMPRIGSTSFCLLSFTPSFTCRLKWMARLLICKRGCLTCNSSVLGWSASSPRTITRPAIVSGRSNHVDMIGPPYTSVFSFTMPPSHSISALGLMRKVGESQWAQIMRNPASAIGWRPMWKA